MEVKSGYKHSEAGIIPEEWDARPLERVFALKHGLAFSSEHFSKSGPIVLTPGNFRLEGGLYFEERNTKRYSGSYTADMAFDRGDLLIVMTDLTPDCNLLGKPAFVESDETILHNQRIGKVLLKDKNANSAFLYYALLSRAYLSHIKKHAFGSTVRHTSNKSIYSAEIAWPPPPEQGAIANALSDVDGLLSGLDRLIAKKRDLKQAAMQQLLTGKTRLPGFYGDWETRLVRELGSIQTGPFGTLLKAEEYSAGDGVPLISVSEVGAGRFRIGEHTPRVPKTVVRRLPQYVLRTGDIVFGRKGAVDRSALVGEIEDGWFLGSDGIRLRPHDGCHPPYLAWQFQRYEVQVWLQQNAIGTTMASLNQGILGRVAIPYAPISEQIAIAAELSDMDAELAALEARREKTRALKQAMMQELLTGRTRLV